MKLKNFYGREVFRNVERFKVDWNAPSKSKFQFRVKQFFRQYWKMDSVFEEFPCIGSLLKIDLFNYTKKIAIEVSGKQHFQFSKHFHNNSRSQFFHSIQNDSKKRKWCEINGILLIEILEGEEYDLSPEFFRRKFNVEI
jgi:hypothetical protein